MLDPSISLQANIPQGPSWMDYAKLGLQQQQTQQNIQNQQAALPGIQAQSQQAQFAAQKQADIKDITAANTKYNADGTTTFNAEGAMDAIAKKGYLADSQALYANHFANAAANISTENDAKIYRDNMFDRTMKLASIMNQNNPGSGDTFVQSTFANLHKVPQVQKIIGDDPRFQVATPPAMPALSPAPAPAPAMPALSPAMPALSPAPAPEAAPAPATTASGVNNPGNIRDNSRPGKFMNYPTMAAGAAASEDLLDQYGKQGVNSVSKIISKWAPPSDNNDTPGYIKQVAAELGVDPDQPLNMNNPAVRGLLASAIARREGNKNTGQPVAQPIAQPMAQPVAQNVPPQGQPVAQPGNANGGSTLPIPPSVAVKATMDPSQQIEVDKNDPNSNATKQARDIFDKYGITHAPGATYNDLASTPQGQTLLQAQMPQKDEMQRAAQDLTLIGQKQSLASSGITGGNAVLQNLPPGLTPSDSWVKNAAKFTGNANYDRFGRAVEAAKADGIPMTTDSIAGAMDAVRIWQSKLGGDALRNQAILKGTPTSQTPAPAVSVGGNVSASQTKIAPGGQGSSAANPFKASNKADFDAIPIGGWFSWNGKAPVQKRQEQ